MAWFTSYGFLLNNDFGKVSPYFIADASGNTWMDSRVIDDSACRLYINYDKILHANVSIQRIVMNTGIFENHTIFSSIFGHVPLILKPTDDLNDCVYNGFINANNCKNAPVVGNFFGISGTWLADTKYAYQMLLCPNEIQNLTNTPRLYIRLKYNDNWTAWHVITPTIL